MRRRDFLRGSATAGLTAATTASAADPRPAAPLRVQVVMFDGVEEQDFAGPYEVFSVAAGHASRGVETSYVRVDGPGVVRASYGTLVEVEHGWAPERADVIVVPGGGYARREGPGVWAEIDRGTLPTALAAVRGRTLAALCTGTLLLGAAGLLRGRPCITHHGAVADLGAHGGILTKARVVDDGDIVTAGGVTSGLDLALWLVRRELGADAAVGVENQLEYQVRGTVWTR
ncbi:DJ-1/PfpI family protein [Actinophytocola sp.]|uniref:DJ-1/PfpI family protein n=1 Tax=Actinophytocola sp. TaxID=1872138 RepID=UPI002D708D96|nr:DJ-1/PfpI family protein [Actinophytocola sp.]HYQ69479.1 DJ-1/PfpI family protein [Actinophytocola sp.]